MPATALASAMDCRTKSGNDRWWVGSMRDLFVYLMSNKPRGTLYVGVTNDLLRRCVEHRDGIIDGFTKRYGVTQLVWFETTPNIAAAIQREKTLKHWPRAWKIDLVERMNPDWRDLFADIAG